MKNPYPLKSLIGRLGCVELYLEDFNFTETHDIESPTDGTISAGQIAGLKLEVAALKLKCEAAYNKLSEEAE